MATLPMYLVTGREVEPKYGRRNTRATRQSVPNIGDFPIPEGLTEKVVEETRCSSRQATNWILITFYYLAECSVSRDKPPRTSAEVIQVWRIFAKEKPDAYREYCNKLPGGYLEPPSELAA